MKKHLMVVSALLAACVLSLAACSKDASPQRNDGGESVPADQTVLYGKVTAVDGGKITLALGTMPQGERGGGNASGGARSGDRRPESGASGGFRGRSGNESGSSRAFRGSSGPAGGGFRNPAELLTLTGETKTITITDESILSGTGSRERPSGPREGLSPQSAESGGSSGSQAKVSLSDITVGSVLRVACRTGDQTPVSVMILGGGNQNVSSEAGK